MTDHTSIVDDISSLELGGDIDVKEGRVDILQLVISIPTGPYFRKAYGQFRSFPDRYESDEADKAVVIDLMHGPAMVSAEKLKTGLEDGGELAAVIDAVLSSLAESRSVSAEAHELIDQFRIHSDDYRDDDWSYIGPGDAIDDGDRDLIREGMTDDEMHEHAEFIKAESLSNKIVIKGDLYKWMKAIQREIEEDRLEDDAA